MAAAPRHLGTFLAAVLRSPARMGAVVPSSRRLAARLAAVVPGEGEPVVLELGPGTGATTAVIAERLGGRGRHLAVEIDPVLAEHLRVAHPDVEVLVGDAAQLADLLAAAGVPAVDAVLSGLPWSLFPEAVQHRIVGEVARALTPHGAFCTFAYLHALPLGGARRFRALLDEVFDEVLTTRVVWRNVPPSVTYVCRRPRALPPAPPGPGGAG